MGLLLLRVESAYASFKCAIVACTDAAIARGARAVSYAAGLRFPSVDAVDVARRSAGNESRSEIASLRLTTGMYFDVCEDFLG